MEKVREGLRVSICMLFFFEEGHKEIEDIQVKTIDRTDVNDPTYKEDLYLWAERFEPEGFLILIVKICLV